MIWWLEFRRVLFRSVLHGGRTWWAHFEFTRINIEPIILRKKIEDLREAGATLPDAAAFSISGSMAASSRRRARSVRGVLTGRVEQRRGSGSSSNAAGSHSVSAVVGVNALGEPPTSPEVG